MRIRKASENILERVGAIALSAPEGSVANWNEGIVYAPDGLVGQFERGSVWQRDSCSLSARR